MSFLCFLSLFVLALCAARVDLVNAQNMTFLTGLFDALDQAGLTNYTAIAKQVTDAGTSTFPAIISQPDEPLQLTLFVPTNIACKFT